MKPATAEPTLRILDDANLSTPDQTRLPFECHPLILASEADCAQAIRTMQVRGAPLIGAVAAFGLAFAVRQAADDESIAKACARLEQTRPTAVNLRWALMRVRDRIVAMSVPDRAVAAWQQACLIAQEDAQINRAIGEHGAALLRDRTVHRARQGRPVTRTEPLQVLTHCNAGRLATVAHGTALAPIYAAHADGVQLHVWVDETRPRNQGSSLTAWELADAGVPCTVIVDNAGGHLMRQGQVDAVIVGCDRVARNGDVANKIGNYLKALAARDCGVPFWVACPTPTIDGLIDTGDRIPIELRDAREVTHISGIDDAGHRREIRLVPEGVDALNPAFDVTPAALVDGLLTEYGLIRADPAAVTAVLVRAGRMAA